MTSFFLSPAKIKSLVKSNLPLRRARNWWRIKAKIAGMQGLEIGGPSPYFETDHLCPVYSILASLVHCNIVESDSPRENSYFLDATHLHSLQDESFDIVMSSHVLEHIANPIKAIKEWQRVLRPSGFILLILPYPTHIFDRYREITRFEHLLEDFHLDTAETDLSHLPEILQKHDLELDPLAKNAESFKKRSLDNFRNRCLHHHVFDLPLARKTLEYCGMQVLMSETLDRYSFLMLARC